MLLFFCAAASAGPTNRYVSMNGGNAIPYDSWANAGTSLIAVVNYANSFNEGDIVCVSNGVYTLTNTVTVGNTVVSNFSANVNGVVVNGNGAVSCFTLSHTNARVEGITISNGFVVGNGAGVTLNNGTVRNCRIVNNRATWSGGGIISSAATVALVDNCTIAYNLASANAGGAGGGGIYGCAAMVVTNCRIYGNTAGGNGGGSYGPQVLQDCIVSNNVSGDCGGGIGCVYQTGPIVNCTIVGNISSNRGGGIFVQRYQTVISNCAIIGNTSGSGGGAYLYYPYDPDVSFDLYNCLFAGNVATNSGAGVVADHFAAPAFPGNHQIALQNCTVVSNRALGATGVGGIWAMNAGGNGRATSTFVNVISYFNVGAGASNWSGVNSPGLNWSWLSFSNSCVAPTGGSYYIGANTFAADPRFISPNDGNYRLSRESPCINTGLIQGWMSGAFDLDGRPRIRDRLVDMGAYESIPKCTFFRGR